MEASASAPWSAPQSRCTGRPGGAEGPTALQPAFPGEGPVAWPSPLQAQAQRFVPVKAMPANQDLQAASDHPRCQDRL